MSRINVELLRVPGVLDGIERDGNSVAGTVDCISVGKPARSGGAAAMADKIASSGHPPSEFRVVVLLLIEPHHSAGCTGDPSDMFQLLRFRDRGRTPCARSIMSWGMPICRASSMSVRGVM